MTKKKPAGYIKSIGEILERDSNRFLQSIGITVTQMRVLEAIKEDDSDDLTVTDTQKALHVTQPTATGIVSRLERDGFIKSSNTKRDRRVKILKLTKKGSNAYDKMDEFMGEMNKDVVRGLNKNEEEQFEELLEKVYDTYDDKDN